MCAQKVDLSLAYENVGFIPGGQRYPDTWSEEARAWREVENAIGRARLNIPYGDAPRQQFDLFYPAGKPAGLVVFIHGGYWRRFDRSFWSHFSAGPTARGWAVAMPSYSLAPQVRISEITREAALAVRAAAAQIDGPIVLSGHSAGGHLAARLVCEDADLPDGISGRVARCMPISPVSDLRPLMQTNINEDLCLDAAEAAAESPILHKKSPGVPVEVWVGAEERPVFLDQARWLAETWQATNLKVAPGRHHFDVIDFLRDPESAMVTWLTGTS